jgi:ABC-type sugar transport system ATPase subunit
MAMSSGVPAVLEGQHLSKSFGPVEVLTDVSVALHPG